MTGTYTHPIDIVILWVDANDPKWRKDFEKYAKQEKNKDIVLQKYQDIGTLKYIFRGVEKFMPWYRKVHLVTYGHYPKWLNLKHPRLQLVTHKQIFKDPSVLPVFNSAAIEVNLHRIPGLAERFVYFNDDMLVIAPVDQSRFFKNGLPRDFLVFSPLVYDIDTNFWPSIYATMSLVYMHIINKLGYRRWLFKQLRKLFTLRYPLSWNIRNLLAFIIPFPLFKMYHFPQPYLKRHFQEAELVFEEHIELVARTRFKEWYSTSQYLVRFYMLAKGEFSPHAPSDTYWAPVESLEEARRHIRVLESSRRRYRFVCFNDEKQLPLKDFPKYRKLLIQYLERILPEKSKFEI